MLVAHVEVIILHGVVPQQVPQFCLRQIWRLIIVNSILLCKPLDKFLLHFACLPHLHKVSLVVPAPLILIQTGASLVCIFLLIGCPSTENKLPMIVIEQTFFTYGKPVQKRLLLGGYASYLNFVIPPIKR